MLKRLTIDNYALIDHLDTEFPGDLVIITGETGAGKSILLGALSLVLGARSDTSAIKDKSRNCVVEAEFDTETGEPVLRRVITPAGRSRCFVDDCPVALEELREVAGNLVDIHSQNQQQKLSDSGFQMSVLDSFAGLGPLLNAYHDLYDDWSEAVRSLDEADRRIAEAERSREYLEFQYSKLAGASLREGELEELESEQGLLANSEQIKSAILAAGAAFESEGCPVEARLKEMASSISKAAPFVEGLASLAERVESARIELKDIADELESRGERIVFSPERLQEVDDRLALLYDLQRKFNAVSVGELITLRDSMKAQLDGQSEDREGRDALAKRAEELRTACESAARRLHAARKDAAGRLSALLQENVRSLEMPHATFAVEVASRPAFGRDGADEVRFLFDANGSSPQDLSKCASGGEMSRIMLAIKALVARYRNMPTMVFDEIDTGVSGSIADKMGRLITDMGASAQVMAITHLPQVASKGSAHYLVYKENRNGSAESNIRRIEGEERVMEIARMLSGERLTDEAVANARVLLKEEIQ